MPGDTRGEIAFLDLRAAYEELRGQIDAAIGRVLSSGRYLFGEEAAAFESEWAGFVGARHCVGVGNGLDAIHLCLRALGVGVGDEVLVPSNTYIATWLGVTMCGAVPVPVEPVAQTYNLDPERVAAAVTPHTRVVVPVHLYGQPADMAAICDVARAHGLWVVEDAAQAHGARYRGRRVGALADLSAWSFYPSKNLGAFGDAGAVTTDDAELAERVRTFANYGSASKYVNVVKGVNSRLDELQAAVLRVKLRCLDEWNDRRRAAARAYLDALAGIPIVLPVVPRWAEPVWHLFVIRHPNRDALRHALAARRIETLVHYPVPPHLQEAYADRGLGEGDLPVAERIHREVFSLPMGPHLAAADVERVVAAVRDAVSSVGGP